MRAASNAATSSRSIGLGRIRRAVATAAVLALGVGLVPALASPAAADEPPLQVTWYSSNAERSFSPTGDNQEDTVYASYCLNRVAQATVVVRNAGGTAVRTLESNRSHPTGCGGDNGFTWDGRSDGGALVGNANYTVNVSLVDTDGHPGSLVFHTAVDTRAPASITAPAPNATVSGNVVFSVQATSGFFPLGSVYLVSGCNGALVDQGAGLWRATVDTTTACASGAINVQAQVQYADAFGYTHYWNSPARAITVDTPVVVSNYSYSERAFSPDGDGNEDTVYSYYCLNRPADVTITVKNAGGTTIRTLQPATSQGGCTAGFWSWDGTNTGGNPQANGNYTINIHAVDSSGHAVDFPFHTAIDKRTPASITAPVTNATVSGNTVFSVQATSGFFPLGSVYLVSGCNGALVDQGAGLWRATVDTTTACASGAINVQAQVQYADAFGYTHYWNSPARAITVDTPVVVSNYSYSERAFSPDGDGNEDTVYSYYCVSRQSNVTITVKNAGGTTIRTLQPATSQGGCTAGFWSWDGTNTGGNPQANGNYTINIHAVDSSGHAVDFPFHTAIDKRTPASITAPVTNATVSGNTVFSVQATSGFFPLGSVYLVSGCSGALVDQGAGLWRATVDTTTACAAGAVNVQAQVQYADAFGYTHYWNSPARAITVNTPVVVTNWGYQERAFSPDANGNEDTVYSYYCLNRPADVTITVKNAGGTTIRTLQTATTQSSCTAGFWSWDGTNTAGQVQPDGAYTVNIHAVDTNAHVADFPFHTTIDTRAPATLTSPVANATLSGVARFVVTPNPAFPLTQVQLSFSSGGGASIYGPSTDGLWRTSMFTGGLVEGPTNLNYFAVYADAYGYTHYWYAPATPVSINTTAIPLDVTATPVTGLAPLATTFHIDTSEPNGAALTYDVDFGDGQTSSGTILNPYNTVNVPHAYVGAGTYVAHISVSNGSGGFAQTTVPITATAPDNNPPTASLSVTPATGVVPVNAVATISGSDPEGAALTYTLDFGDGTTSTGSLPHAPVPHTYAHAGTFTVRLGVSDGGRTTVGTDTVSVGLSEPLTANAGDDQTATVNAPVHFDGSASRPLIGIDSYSWSFGDGATAAGPVADHTYTSVGTKTATLTVTAGGTTRTDPVSVDVQPVPVTPGLSVMVDDVNGNHLPGADVAILDSDGVRHAAVTAANGVAIITGLTDGEYAVYAYKAGYKPSVGNGVQADGSGTSSVVLKSGAIAQTAMTSERLTEAQIIAAGIDPNDPQNQNVYQFEIHLAFVDEGQEITFEGYANEGEFIGEHFSGGGGGGGCGSACYSSGGFTLYPHVEVVDETPTIVWMVIPGKAKWLKEFFQVSLMVTNLAEDTFTFQNGHASLGELPAGLSLAPTGTPQELVQDMPDIAPGASEMVSWIVRGDSAGLYKATAQYSGTLEPLGSSVLLDAETADGALHVWGGDAVHMIVDTDDHAYVGSPYRIRIGLENVSNIPVYNPSIELLEEGRVNYIYQPQERLEQGASVIPPGETVWTDYYRLVPEIGGTLSLSQSFVKKTAGNVDVQSDIISHPATLPGSLPAFTKAAPSGSSTVLSWDAVPGATSYELYVTPTRDTAFGATPVLTVPASQHSAAVTTGGFYAVSAVTGDVRTMHHTLLEVEGPAAPTHLRGVLPAIYVSNVVVHEGNTGPTSATATLHLSEASSSTITVKVATADGTATAPGDYTAVPQTTVTIPAGTRDVPVALSVAGDSLSEGSEAFTLSLSAATGATIADTSATITILDEEGPLSLYVGDTSVNEGGAGAHPSLVFPLRLSAAPGTGQTVTVTVVTADGTAAAAGDYTALASQPVTFSAGQTSKTVTVAVNGDATVEASETIQLKLSGSSGALLADTAATGTIVNDDGTPTPAPAPTITIDDVVAQEGGTANVTVRLSAPAPANVTVKAATADGTAKAPSDYTKVNATTVTFTPGQTTRTFPVSVPADGVGESDEAFTVKLTVPSSGTTIADTAGTVTIVGDAGAVSLYVSDAGVNEGAPGAHNALEFKVTLSAASTQPVTVKYQTADTTAKVSDGDYTAQPLATLSFAAGETSKTVAVSTNGDAVNEPNETLQLKLSVASGALLADTVGLGTIVTDEGPPPSISVRDVVVREGSSGTTTGVVVLGLSEVSAVPVSVKVATSDVSAKAPGDYTAIAQTTVTFPAGATTLPVTVTVAGDTLAEGTETFALQLTGSVGAAIADSAATVTVIDEEGPLSIYVGDASVNEGGAGAHPQLVFPIKLSAAPGPGQSVSVNVVTADGTATVAGGDYTALSSQTITFVQGELTKTVPVTLNGDTTAEPSETVSLKLSAQVGALLADNIATGTLVNDDPTAGVAPGPVLSIDDAVAHEGDSGTSNVTTTVRLSSAAATSIVVKVASADGTAKSPGDYAKVNLTTLTFAPGETAKTISTTVVGDTFSEGDEAFTLKLSGQTSGVVLADSIGTVTIVDEEGPIGLYVTDAATTETDAGGSSNLVFTLSLSAAPAAGQTVTVKYTTGDTTAKASLNDYTSLASTQVTFLPGETTKTVTVVAKGDTESEVNETMQLKLSGQVGASLADSVGVGTIIDND